MPTWGHALHPSTLWDYSYIGRLGALRLLGSSPLSPVRKVGNSVFRYRDESTLEPIFSERSKVSEPHAHRGHPLQLFLNYVATKPSEVRVLKSCVYNNVRFRKPFFRRTKLDRLLPYVFLGFRHNWKYLTNQPLSARLFSLQCRWLVDYKPESAWDSSSKFCDGRRVKESVKSWSQLPNSLPTAYAIRRISWFSRRLKVGEPLPELTCVGKLSLTRFSNSRSLTSAQPSLFLTTAPSPTNMFSTNPSPKKHWPSSTPKQSKSTNARISTETGSQLLSPQKLSTVGASPVRTPKPLDRVRAPLKHILSLTNNVNLLLLRRHKLKNTEPVQANTIRSIFKKLVHRLRRQSIAKWQVCPVVIKNGSGLTAGTLASRSRRFVRASSKRLRRLVLTNTYSGRRRSLQQQSLTVTPLKVESWLAHQTVNCSNHNLTDLWTDLRPKSLQSSLLTRLLSYPSSYYKPLNTAAGLILPTRTSQSVTSVLLPPAKSRSLPSAFISPSHSNRFSRSLFFFTVSTVSRMTDILPRGSFRPKMRRSSIRFLVFPDANAFKVAVFRRLNRQKLLTNARFDAFNAISRTGATSAHHKTTLDHNKREFLSNQPINYSRLRWSFANSAGLRMNTDKGWKLNAFRLARTPLCTNNSRPDVRIRRIRFKPGYGRIWRTARESVREILNMPHRYQYRLTPKLQKHYFVYRQRSLPPQERGTTLTLEYALMTCHFAPDIWYVNTLSETFSVFLNGSGESNLGAWLFRGDFIQLAVSLKFYMASRWIKNWSMLKQQRVNKLFYRKFRPSETNRHIRFARTLPNWFFGIKYTYCSIPKCFEVDFFTLSIFLLYGRVEWESPTPRRLYQLDTTITNMYNWKYIT